ncbi:hypothetical protein [uncultured Stenotrophomonas sp.]|uniref:hypothetical protein n=1 Tax=uncultured Stenotrophomonas sp. TaxID=165438 RepID=UPI0025ED0F25|nr:hypothetical protein [uncultured Stenotrophomonas sp.]
MPISKEESDRLREVRGAEFFERYNKPHPYAHNLLQGHLFIEEQLEVIVMSAFLKPEAVIEAKLSFWTKLKLAQGVTGESSTYWLAIDKLNSARNELAHGRDMTVLERKIDDFISAAPKSGKQHHQKNASRAQKLNLAIVRVAAYIARTAEDYRPEKPATGE